MKIKIKSLVAGLLLGASMVFVGCTNEEQELTTEVMQKYDMLIEAMKDDPYYTENEDNAYLTYYVKQTGVEKCRIDSKKYSKNVQQEVEDWNKVVQDYYDAYLYLDWSLEDPTKTKEALDRLEKADRRLRAFESVAGITRE